MTMLSSIVLQQIHSVEMPRIDGRASFVAWLKFCHGIMRASVPLLQIATAKSRDALRDYYRAHLDEESDHADWLAEDLATLGEMPPKIDHAAAATAGAQWYYLEHVGPQALLGYLAANEFVPMPLADVDKLAQAFGESALRTVRHHAREDVEHAKELAGVIDLHEPFADVITYSAFVTRKMLAHYVGERMKNG